MKAWLVDAVVMGLPFGILKWLWIGGGGIGGGVLGGAIIGAAMATFFAWREVPSVGRRYFAKPS